MVSYDYIVVGAGSAGAVVAGRLSESASARVLLLDAGGSQKNLNVQIPLAFGKQFKSELDWEFYTEPEPYLNGRSLFYPRGKTLGGCSSMNAMIYIRGNRDEFDSWAKDGATGWSYDEVLPYFRKSECNSRGESAYHGGSGPLRIEDLRSPNDLSYALVEGMVAAGLPRNDDFNGAEQVGAGFNQVCQKRGRRWTTADAFIDPVRSRSNLTVWSETHVLGLRLRGNRVTGVEVERGGVRETVSCEREVILSAGALNTPQILMLSGIGPADHLAEHGIEAVVDNPNVGAHLMDHPLYTTNFETTAKGTLAGAESPVQLANWFLRKRGMLTSNLGEVGAFFHTRSGETAPDMQIIGGPGYFFDHGFRSHERPAYVFACSLVAPRSRGAVRLRSADPKDKVATTYNFLAEQADMDAMVAAIERVREFAGAVPLRRLTTKEINPGREHRTKAELEAVIRREVSHTYHAACSARIGSERTGVVDPQLRVHGVEGLRVADASVFPTVTHGNTHAPSVMVGEKAADMIRTGL
ncbi:GMC family oxidoreductase [Saccharopolyspora shandongensis]|uniref:GMC family oxidoreductase n=1 Tax=Saccharopolyspora shandongensis TaxID=418495 RepID=UPI0033C62C70